MSALAVVERPNGKTYRARKAPAVLTIENDHLGEVEIMVLRTHDLDAARPLAEAEARRQGIDWHGDCVSTLSWAREAIRDGDPWWEYDPDRGAACIVFRPDELPNAVDL